MCRSGAEALTQLCHVLPSAWLLRWKQSESAIGRTLRELRLAASGCAEEGRAGAAHDHCPRVREDCCTAHARRLSVDGACTGCAVSYTRSCLGGHLLLPCRSTPNGATGPQCHDNDVVCSRQSCVRREWSVHFSRLQETTVRLLCVLLAARLAWVRKLRQLLRH